MKRWLAVAAVFGVFVVAGCKKKKDGPHVSPGATQGPATMKPEPGTEVAPPTGTTQVSPASADGARRVAIEVTDEGFNPASIPAKVGEHLTLVFTRTTTSPCGGEVVLKSSGERKELPLNEPVELAVNVDKAGQVDFSCGMEMMQGAIVVQ